jgi:hypothetical protein
MSEQKVVMLKAPKALEQLISSNNELLRKYKEELFEQIKEANQQMMQILKLDPAQGWKLDLDKMMYVRLTTEEEAQFEEPSEDVAVVGEAE